MRNLKKIISLALALMMVLSMMVTANAAFADQDSITADYVEAVEVMNALGILQGNNGSFNPAGTLTRAEAAVILAKAHSGASSLVYFQNATKYSENPFSDVPSWAVPYVVYCYDNAITGGVGGDKYAPSKALTGYEFAKMMLVAAGFGKHADYVGDENQTWEQKTLAAAKSAKLLDGLEIALKQNISREQAAQMALNAMKAGGETTTTYYVVSVADTTAPNVAPRTYMSKTDNAMEAYFAYTVMGDTICKVHEVTTTAGNLLADVWHVDYTPGTTDTFGRPADLYVIPAAITGTTAVPMYYTYAPVATFTSYTAPAGVAAALAGRVTASGNYTVNWDTVTTPITYSYDLVADGSTSTPSVSANFATVVSGMTDSNKVVEVYANAYGKLYKVVTVGTYADEIDSVYAGDVANNIAPTATISAGTFVNAAGYQKGDVITYNLCNGAVVNTAKATGFEGKLTGYSSQGVYTVNGAPYYIYDAGSEAVAISTLSTGASKMYYPGDAGTILYVGAMPYEAPVVYGDYAMILDTNVAQGPVVWPATTASYTISLKVLKADGTVAYWTLPNVKSDANGAYFTTGDVATSIAPLYVAYSDGATDLDGMIGVVYTTNGDTIVKEVAPKADNSLPGAFGVAGQTITPGTTYVVDGDVFLNENTKFIMRAADYAVSGKYMVKTGLTSLTENLTGAYVIGSQTYDAVKDVYTRVATLVFAEGTSVFSGAVDTANVVYNTGVYTVVYNAALKTTVYNYTVVDTKGAYGTVSSLSDIVAPGLYTVDSNGFFGSTVDTTSLTVTGVYGTTVAVTGGYYVVDGDTTVYDVSTAAKGIVAGAKLFVIDTYSDKKADIVFVVDDITYTVSRGAGYTQYSDNTWEVTTAAGLNHAVTNAAEGDTLTLADDITLTALVNITRDVTIDLNGCDISRTDGTALYVTGGTVTIEGEGTVNAKAGAVYVAGGTVIINGGTYHGVEGGTIIACGRASQVTINDATVEAEQYAVRTWASAQVTINDGEFTSGKHTIFACESSVVNTIGGTFTAGTGYVTEFNNAVDECPNCNLPGTIN